MTVRSSLGILALTLTAGGLLGIRLAGPEPAAAQALNAAQTPITELPAHSPSAASPIGRYQLSSAGDRMLDTATGILYLQAGEFWQVAASLPAALQTAQSPAAAAPAAPAAAQPTPATLQLRALGPGAATVGSNAEFIFDATNPLSTAVSGATLTLQLDRAQLKPEAATAGIPASGELVWSQLTFAPGETRRFRVVSRCLKEGRACVIATLATPQGPSQSQETCTTITATAPFPSPTLPGASVLQ